MAIDFQSVKQQIQKMGENAPALARQYEEKRQQAEELLEDNAQSQVLLRERIEAALRFNQNLRSALPGNEPLDARFPLPPLPEKVSLLAADGSQIYPDRHAAATFSLINVGAIRMTLGEAAAPSQTITTELLYDDSLYTETGQITESLVALMRDLGEREQLANLAENMPGPVLTLTDGPLELWEPRDLSESDSAYKKKFDEYLGALRRLNELNASTAGYIDKPGSDLIVRMLEIASFSLTELRDKAGKARPFKGVTDVSLLSKILRLHERSAIFGIQSKNAGRYADELAIHFFYLNVGTTPGGAPYLARVEIPAWVAENAEMVDTLHAVLIAQCKVLGNRPYPYLLHRSHEVALVTFDEKQQVENMIHAELRRHGIDPGTQSYKSYAKQSGKRNRYG